MAAGPKQRHLPRIMGHRKGIETVREVVRECRQLGIEVLTLYAFSTENWRRPKTEIKALMALLKNLYVLKRLSCIRTIPALL